MNAQSRTKRGRPRIKDRARVKSRTVTLKLSPVEARLLDGLVSEREAEIRDESKGGHVDLSVSSYIRWLLDREAKAKGLRP